MNNELDLNIEELLQPISAEAPTGTDLRLNNAPDAVYYELREARQNARAIERNTPPEENTDRLELDHWKTIVKKAPEVLKNQSKDLEVAAWYTEGLLRLHGFAGLRAGVTLINGLIQQYWDGLYPMPDEEGIETRVAVLKNLNGTNNNGTLIAPINTAPITKDGLYSTWSYTQAVDLAKTTDAKQKQKQVAAGVVPVETIKASVKPSASEFYQTLAADLDATFTEFTTLETQLNTLCGDVAPQTGAIERALKSAKTALNVIAKEILQPKEELVMDNEGNLDLAADLQAPITVDASLNSNIKDRLAALKNLQNLADFFKRTEPHSPIGFTLERIVRWGDMSLPELLQELIPDPNAKDYYQKLVGILPPPPAAPMMGQAMPNQPNMYNDPYQNNMMGGQPPMGHDPYAANNFGAPPAPGFDNPMFK